MRNLSGALRVIAFVLLAFALKTRAHAESGGGGSAVPPIRIESESDVDWRPYAKALKIHVGKHWSIPTEAKRGRKGAATLHFFITRSGELRELETLVRRGPRALTRAARAAVEEAAPFPPLPLPEDGEERVGVTWSFYYNFDEDDAARWSLEVEEALERRKAAERGGE